MTTKIGLLVGSVRKNSLNRLVAEAITPLFPEDYEVKIIQIGDLEHYNQDFDDEGPLPESYVRFRNEIKNTDGFVFLSPEYNRSIPSVLKNAIDVGSRPFGQSSWVGQPAAVITVAHSNLGGALANHQLRQALVFTNSPVMQQPEAYLSEARVFNDDHTIKEDSMAFLQSFVDSFVEFLEKNK